MLRLYDILLLDFFEDNDQSKVLAFSQSLVDFRLGGPYNIASVQNSKDNAYWTTKIKLEGSFVELLNSHFVINCSSEQNIFRENLVKKTEPENDQQTQYRLA